MIYSSNRYPGQLLPVGAKYHYNMGKPLRDVAGLSGVSDDLRPRSIGAMAVTPDGEIVGERGSRLTRMSPALILVSIAIRGGLGYVAGRAMAPTAAKKNKYGWYGVLSGGVFGVTGLAVQGAVALSKK